MPSTQLHILTSHTLKTQYFLLIHHKRVRNFYTEYLRWRPGQGYGVVNAADDLSFFLSNLKKKISMFDKYMFIHSLTLTFIFHQIYRQIINSFFYSS